MKKLVIFDLDGTLTASKQPLDGEMADLLGKLIGFAAVAVISGGSYPQFQKQFLSYLNLSPGILKNLVLVPTNGSAMYRFSDGEWREVYAETLSLAERRKIIDTFGEAFKAIGFVPDKVLYGDQIEDRGTQVTFSGLGQLAPVELKKKWDPDRRKRMPIKEYLDKRIPEFEVRVNSSSSIDVTKKGIDKAYGIRRLSDYLKIPVSRMIFIGDALFPGGNDFAAISTGVETVPVADEKETKVLIKKMIAGVSG